MRRGALLGARAGDGVDVALSLGSTQNPTRYLTITSDEYLFIDNRCFRYIKILDFIQILDLEKFQIQTNFRQKNQVSTDDALASIALVICIRKLQLQVSRPHALIINQKKFFFLYSTLAAVLTYDYQRSLCKVRNRMFITTLMIHSSTVHDPSALKDGLHHLYICRITCAGSVCCMAGLPVPEQN